MAVKELNCIVATPEETALESPADFVVLPLHDGEIGIAVGRAPLVGRLGFGEMRLHIANRITRYYLDGGFVQLVNNEISVITNQAVPVRGIDLLTVREQLEQARKLPATTPEQRRERDRKTARARAQIQLAERQGA